MNLESIPNIFMSVPVFRYKLWVCYFTKLNFIEDFLEIFWSNEVQKQSSGCVLQKSFSENVEEIYKKTPEPEFFFNKFVTLSP